MTDPAAQAAYSNALRVRGVAITLQRVSGFTPNVAVVSSVPLTAIVMNLTPDSGLAAADLTNAGPGSIRLADRTVDVMARDLTNSGFALPVVQGDQILLPDSSELLTITKVDAYTKRFAGAIVLTCAGVT